MHNRLIWTMATMPYLSCTDMWVECVRAHSLYDVRHKNNQSSVVWICRGERAYRLLHKKKKVHKGTWTLQKDSVWTSESVFYWVHKWRMIPVSWLVRWVHLFPRKLTRLKDFLQPLVSRNKRHFLTTLAAKFSHLEDWIKKKSDWFLFVFFSRNFADLFTFHLREIQVSGLS